MPLRLICFIVFVFEPADIEKYIVLFVRQSFKLCTGNLLLDRLSPKIRQCEMLILQQELKLDKRCIGLLALLLASQ